MSAFLGGKRFLFDNFVSLDALPLTRTHLEIPPLMILKTMEMLKFLLVTLRSSEEIFMIIFFSSFFLFYDYEYVSLFNDPCHTLEANANDNNLVMRENAFILIDRFIFAGVSMVDRVELSNPCKSEENPKQLHPIKIHYNAEFSSNLILLKHFNNNRHFGD